MIVFYEHDYCEEILTEGVDSIRQRDLNYLAKYWDDQGYEEDEIRENLEEFATKNDKNFNAIQSAYIIQRAIIHARNNYIRTPRPINITEYELEQIQRVEDYKIQKFLFIMLVCAKFFKYHPSRKNITRSQYDQYLYSNTSIKSLKELAGVNFTNKEWNIIKHDLTTMGLINPTIISKTKWAIGFWNEMSPVAIKITDYRNPVSYYQEYAGMVMINCIECGVLISKRSNRHSYCSKCWKKKRREDIKNNVQKYREKNKM